MIGKMIGAKMTWYKLWFIWCYKCFEVFFDWSICKILSFDWSIKYFEAFIAALSQPHS